AKLPKPIDPITRPPDFEALGLDPARFILKDGIYTQQLRNGYTATISLEPSLQKPLQAYLVKNKVAHGGVVLLEPNTGRVLAMAEASSAKPAFPAFSRTPHAPSASVFKVVTAAALVAEAKLTRHTQTCYHGGRSRLTNTNIDGDKRLDTRCASLSDAVAWSINSVIAKRAKRHLSQTTQDAWAKRFGYNESIPFDLPVARSHAASVQDPYDRARQAAGFLHSSLSPLHGALIASAPVNDGVMMRPYLVSELIDASGRVVYRAKPTPWRRVMPPDIAREVAAMMSQTTQKGTARRYFTRTPIAWTTGGKTGTLSQHKPSFLRYTWFVGFAHDERRKIAVSALACNTPLWHVNGPGIAAEALSRYIRKGT
ncbi:MAG: penicillin-binding transpeptidase domain-containing protein, partial [Myxococcota bacterium]